MMGELFASQVHHAIARCLQERRPNDRDLCRQQGSQRFMKKKVFDPGGTLPWNDLTEHATGEKLNAKAFAEDFKAK